MVDVITGIGAEQGAEDADFLKGDEGTPPPEGQGGEPPEPQGKPAEPGTPVPDPDQEIRAELVKRYGEKSDQELLREVWKSYRSGETTFTQATEKAKELEGLVNQFGGADALRESLKAPVAPSTEAKYPEKIQVLIDSGHLDPNDPRDALIIDQETRLEQGNKAIARSTYNEAVGIFETGLKGIAGKYEYADIDAIREMGHKGLFTHDTDAQMWAKIDGIASRQHERVVGLVDKTTQSKLDALKAVNDKKPLDGKPGGGKPTNPTTKQAFDAEYLKHFPNG